MIDISDPAALRAEAERRQQLRARGAQTFERSEASNLLTPRAEQRDRMNKTERRRSVELEALQRGNIVKSWQFEAITLLLADRCRYTPDFFVEYADGRLVFEEVKGFWRDDARVKIKVAARLYPMFAFRALTVRRERDGGGWNREEF